MLAWRQLRLRLLPLPPRLSRLLLRLQRQSKLSCPPLLLSHRRLLQSSRCLGRLDWGSCPPLGACRPRLRYPQFVQPPFQCEQAAAVRLVVVLRAFKLKCRQPVVLPNSDSPFVTIPHSSLAFWCAGQASGHSPPLHPHQRLKCEGAAWSAACLQEGVNARSSLPVTPTSAAILQAQLCSHPCPGASHCPGRVSSSNEAGNVNAAAGHAQCAR